MEELAALFFGVLGLSSYPLVFYLSLKKSVSFIKEENSWQQGTLFLVRRLRRDRPPIVSDRILLPRRLAALHRFSGCVVGDRPRCQLYPEGRLRPDVLEGHPCVLPLAGPRPRARGIAGSDHYGCDAGDHHYFHPDRGPDAVH